MTDYLIICRSFRIFFFDILLILIVRLILLFTTLIHLGLNSL